MSDNPHDQPNADDLTPEQIDALRDPNNAALPEAINAKKKRAAAAAKREAKRLDDVRKFLAAALTCEEGKVFVVWLLDDVAGIYRQTVPVDMDPHRTLFLDGAKGVGIALHEMLIKADAATYMAAMAQHLKDRSHV